MDYYCNSCEESFDEPRVLREYHGNPYSAPETFEVCPYCGESDYGERRLCSNTHCDVVGTDWNMHPGTLGWLCKKCWGEEELD